MWVQVPSSAPKQQALNLQQPSKKLIKSRFFFYNLVVQILIKLDKIQPKCNTCNTKCNTNEHKNKGDRSPLFLFVLKCFIYIICCCVVVTELLHKCIYLICLLRICGTTHYTCNLFKPSNAHTATLKRRPCFIGFLA